MLYDLIIVGSGPAGLTAAIYATRAQKNVLVIEKEAYGGLITHSPKVENYPGVASISGLDLASNMVNQAMDLNVNFDFGEITKITKENNIFTLYSNDSRTFNGLSVILATGSTHRKLNLANEDRLVGKGISYCAVCDGPFYAKQDVAIIGGGNSAMQEAILLSSYCQSVTMIQNLSCLTGEKDLEEQIKKTPNIKVIYNTIVTALNGDNRLRSIEIENTTTNEKQLLEFDGIFVAVGHVANNEAFKEYLDLDEQGFIKTDELCHSKLDGLFVAGDCVSKKIRQIVTATSDGAIASLQAIRYLDNLKIN